MTGFAVGDEVYGVGGGSFAEYAVARADKLARKPVSFSFEQAAVVPISGATALQALTDHGRLESGQRVLVIGASGGAGSYAVQIAKALGAEVTGVASTVKRDWSVRSARTMSSTTRVTISLEPVSTTTWFSTSQATPTCAGCGVR